MVTGMGTPAYMAPEIENVRRDARGKKRSYGKPSDIWSFGCIVHLMLFNELYVDKTSYEDRCNILLKEHSHPEISKSAHNFLVSTLAIKPGDRLSATQLLKHPWITGEETTELYSPKTRLRSRSRVTKSKRYPGIGTRKRASSLQVGLHSDRVHSSALKPAQLKTHRMKSSKKKGVLKPGTRVRSRSSAPRQGTGKLAATSRTRRRVRS